MEEKKKIQPPSETFERVIQRAGSLVQTCELCKRVHFATAEEGVFEKGELADLRAKAKARPGAYIEDGSYDSVSWGTIDGQQAVIGCPCNGLRRYENFIWNNRFLIMEYLKQKAKDQLEEATRLAKDSAEAAEAVEKAEGA